MQRVLEFLEIFPTHDPTQPTKNPLKSQPNPTCGSTQPMDNFGSPMHPRVGEWGSGGCGDGIRGCRPSAFLGTANQTQQLTSCHSNGNDRQHRRRPTHRSIAFARWSLCACTPSVPGFSVLREFDSYLVKLPALLCEGMTR